MLATSMVALEIKINPVSYIHSYFRESNKNHICYIMGFKIFTEATLVVQNYSCCLHHPSHKYLLNLFVKLKNNNVLASKARKTNEEGQ